MFFQCLQNKSLVQAPPLKIPANLLTNQNGLRIHSVAVFVNRLDRACSCFVQDEVYPKELTEPCSQ